ncbi:hypothetical protein ASE85_17115 [Sphingobium sp. Leaf26]|uniref:Arm DNA-binding domain-containing protein n=1 Tax=Sphingobium sp. Leaf26 TaxID=1735693 RepID=UPI0006F68BD9|nr:Arm DNA-binding domain-containing protein [Sphingobium sp. Leaf26]KQN08644.1 hypothetical protein ASE85_17115 [Sphingobium sp. Leaf26]
MLSHSVLTSLKAHDKPIEKSDGGGLLIRVEPSGRKLWQFAYRFDGKQKTLNGGVYPDTSLAQARVWRDRNKGLIANGRYPSCLLEERKSRKHAHALTFEALVLEWLKARKSS